jgi:hypothetical protein
MSATGKQRLLFAGIGALALALTAPTMARADDYTDLLDILKAKGSLTQSEYGTLLAKHRHTSRTTRRTGRNTTADTSAVADEGESDAAAARQAAASAAASASQAQQAASSMQLAMKDPLIVHTTPYVPGKGVTFVAGPVTVNITGFINGFYTFNSPGKGQPVNGGLSSGADNGFDSSSVRNGLLPGALITKLSTTQGGYDLSAVFGAYPGLNNADPGAFNANSGGSAVALGTPGLDFRQVFVTVGNDSFGTVKVGRDIGLFGSDAILNDATLLSVGSPGGNTQPANTSLGRIGIGYVYTDWLPQITYTTPIIAGGFTASVGLFTPLDEVNFAGGGVSATSTVHSAPMFQGQLSYKSGTMLHLWADGLVQPHQDVVGALIPAGINRKVTSVAGDAGASVNFGPLGAVVYGYRGSGLGTTGLFFDGVDAAGNKRDSDGYYVQGSYKILPKLKLVGSYGVSNLYEASGEIDPLLVRRNESEIGAGYYTLTDWMTLVAEYAHTTAHSHGPDKGNDNTVSLGTIVFF